MPRVYKPVGPSANKATGPASSKDTAPGGKPAEDKKNQTAKK